MGTPLKLVDPDKPAKAKTNMPPPSRPRSVLRAAQSGDDIALLTALRDRVAKSIQAKNTPPRDLSSLSKRLMEINGELRRAIKNSETTSAASGVGDEAWEGV